MGGHRRQASLIQRLRENSLLGLPDGHISYQERHDRNLATERDRQPTLDLYFSRQTRVAPGEKVRFCDLYEHFLKWCHKYHVTPISANSFGKECRIRGFPTYKASGTTYKMGVRPIYPLF